MISQQCLELICCPRCGSELRADVDGGQTLSCRNCPSTFPVVAGIPVLLDECDDEVSSIIKGFYDNQWKRDDAGVLAAKARHEDLSDFGQRYIKDNEERFLPLFAGGGDVFLDAAAGAQPRTEFGANYSYHLCVDFSLDALVECRRILGDRGIYVCGSLLNLPIKAGTCDGILASHCLYHIAADRQHTAISELARALRPGGTLLIFYSNPDSPERLLGKALRKALGSKEGVSGSGETFYYHPHAIRKVREMLTSEFGDGAVTVKPLRLFSRRVTGPIFRRRLLGSISFPILRAAEGLFDARAGLASYLSYMAVKDPDGAKRTAPPPVDHQQDLRPLPGGGDAERPDAAAGGTAAR